jgi:hypothetical protein
MNESTTKKTQYKILLDGIKVSPEKVHKKSSTKATKVETFTTLSNKNEISDVYKNILRVIFMTLRTQRQSKTY